MPFLSVLPTFQAEIVKRLNGICAQVLPYLSQEVSPPAWPRLWLGGALAGGSRGPCPAAGQRGATALPHGQLLAPGLGSLVACSQPLRGDEPLKTVLAWRPSSSPPRRCAVANVPARPLCWWLWTKMGSVLSCLRFLSHGPLLHRWWELQAANWGRRVFKKIPPYGSSLRSGSSASLIDAADGLLPLP